MEGGNGATIGSGITHSPLGEKTPRGVHNKTTKRETSSDGARPWAPCRYRKSSISQKCPPEQLDRGCVSRLSSKAGEDAREPVGQLVIPCSNDF